MSKIRNSLGVLVLPVPNEPLSFAQYKQRYGINLDEVFILNDDDATIVKPSFTKVIYLSFEGVSSPYQNPIVPSSVSPDGETSKLVLFYPSFSINVEDSSIAVTSFMGIRVSVLDKVIEYCEI